MSFEIKFPPKNIEKMRQKIDMNKKITHQNQRQNERFASVSGKQSSHILDQLLHSKKQTYHTLSHLNKD